MKIRYFEKRGQIWLDFKDQTGARRRIPSGVATEPQARALTAQLVADAMAQATVAAASPQVPVKAITPASGWTIKRAYEHGLRTREKWLLAKNKVDLDTRYKGVTAYFGESFDLAGCNRAAVLLWREQMMASEGKRKDSKLSNSTINHRLSMLSTLLEVAELPPHGVKHLSVLNSRRKRRTREDEIQAVISWLLANHDRVGATTFADLVQVALACAARQGELLALRWADVYLDRKVVCFRETKNGDAREVPLTDAAMRVLERRRGYNLDGPFANLSTDRCTALWAQARKAVGLEHDHEFVFHVATRHEGLSRMAEAGGNAFQIKAMAGHRNISTSDRYVKPKVESLRDMAQRAADAGAST